MASVKLPAFEKFQFVPVDGVVVVVVLPPLEAAVMVAVTEAFTLVVSLSVAVMVAVPAALPVTSPAELTVAMLVLLLDHVTSFVASAGDVVAESCLVAFTAIEKLPLGLIATLVAGTFDAITTSKSLMGLFQPSCTVTVSVPV